MSKKGKKFETTEAQESATLVDHAFASMQEGVAKAEPAPASNVSNLPPRKPGLVVEVDGVKYKFDRRNHLPKRAGKAPAGDIRVQLNGQDVPAWITSNRTWAKDDKSWLDYIWLTVPEGTDVEGQGATEQHGYITLDYTVEATTFSGKEFTAGYGATDRANPTRLGKLDEQGQPLDNKRVEAFRESMAKKKAAAEVPADTVPEGTEQQTAEQPSA